MATEVPAAGPQPAVGGPHPRPGRPTLHDVAADAGVSAMSVSRVLSGTGYVSPEMRRRVQRSVARLGYRRNENARSLRPGQRTGLVGVIVTNIDNPYYAQVLLGIEHGLDASRRRILVGMSHGDPGREARLVSDFVARQVEGLVVVPSGGNDSLATQIGDLPVVLASRADRHVRADTVVIDDEAGSYEGVRVLIAEGHRRIAFLGNAPIVDTSERRFAGFRRALTDAGLTVSTDLVDRSCRDIDSSRAAALRVIDTELAPTAIFCANNQVTIGALEALASRPETTDPRIEVMGVDSVRTLGALTHPLWVIDHDPQALGRAAARLLLHRLDGDDPDAPVAKLTLPTTLHRI